MRAGHFPTEPVHAGSHSQAGGVVRGCGETDEGLCQWIGFMPPVVFSYIKGLMHVGDASGVYGGAEEDESCFGKIDGGGFGFWLKWVWFGRSRRGIQIL